MRSAVLVRKYLFIRQFCTEMPILKLIITTGIVQSQDNFVISLYIQLGHCILTYNEDM